MIRKPTYPRLFSRGDFSYLTCQNTRDWYIVNKGGGWGVEGGVEARIVLHYLS